MPFLDREHGRAYYRHWAAPQPHAVVIFLHGFGEHTGLYHRYGFALNAAGIDLWAVDQLGHGLSPGDRGDFGSIEDTSLLADMLTELAEHERPGLPLIAQGHSFGSVVTLFRLLERPDRFRAGVISGAPLVPIPELLDADTAFDLEPGWLSSDPFYLDALENDPLAFVRSSLGEIERLGTRVSASASGPDAALAHELRDLRTLAEEARAGVDRIARLVEDMRLLFHGAATDVDEVEMEAVVEDALRAAGLDRKDAPRVVVSEEGRLPRVRGSAERLTQALLQLLENARAALAETPDPVIRVALRREGDHVELEVSDNGPGIPEHLRERIFDPFFSTRGPDQGTGLGLALAFDVAREHGGVLEERSARGRGAVFVLRLPAVAES